MKPKIIIHGGAWDIPEKLHKAHLQGIEKALRLGQKVLKSGDNALKAVVEIIKNMENNPTFDAGKGSFLNSRGEVEMDAGIMLGDDLSAGAVAGIQNVKNPIKVADLVRSKTQHVLLVGTGARDFAQEHGIKFVETGSLLIGREKELYKELANLDKVIIKSFFEEHYPSDTVGAVAIDSKGSIAAGTSTGGTPFKKAGRVGDSPIVGAGFYADNRIGGVSTTGWGEGILLVQLAKETINNLQQGLSPKKSTETAISFMKNQVNGYGGVITIDKTGHAAYSFNTPYMAVGAADLDTIEYVSLGDH